MQDMFTDKTTMVSIRKTMKRMMGLCWDYVCCMQVAELLTT